MSKFVVLAAGAAGYVLGARAGRERYEQIKGQFDRVWNDPAVQKAASDAQDLVAEQAPVIKDKASAAAAKAAGKVKGDGATPKHAETQHAARPERDTPSTGSSRS